MRGDTGWRKAAYITRRGVPQEQVREVTRRGGRTRCGIPANELTATEDQEWLRNPVVHVRPHTL